jgi:probable phosphoglycerate mutase
LAEHPGVVLHRRAGLREYYFGGLEGVTNNQLISASLARYGVKTMTHAWTRGERFAQLIRNFEKMDHTKQAESLPELRLRVQTSFAQIVAAQPDDAKVLGGGSWRIFKCDGGLDRARKITGDLIEKCQCHPVRRG